MQRIFKYGDIQNTALLVIKRCTVHFEILHAFLCHHIQELYTYKFDEVNPISLPFCEI